MKFRVKYKRIRVTVTGEKPKYCEACFRMGRVELHHWFYLYSTKEVRKDQQLALRNASWLCFQCHDTANAVRKLFAVDSDKRIKLWNLMWDAEIKQEVNHEARA